MKIRESDQVHRFQSGQPGAFDAFYGEYGDQIYRFCYRLCGHTADAEDLTQEVFLAAYQGLDRFAGRSSVTTWLYRIAKFRWGRLHDQRRIETVPLDEEMVGAAAAPDPASAGVERLSLENALLALPDGLRQAFLLVKAEGLKYREAAQVLGVPQGTIQSRVHDAVVRLRALLAADEGETSAASGQQADIEHSGARKASDPHSYRCEPFRPGSEADG
jgi:RNA polymerase sigma-70 factor (ECF subfamily)